MKCLQTMDYHDGGITKLWGKTWHQWLQLITCSARSDTGELYEQKLAVETWKNVELALNGKSSNRGRRHRLVRQDVKDSTLIIEQAPPNVSLDAVGMQAGRDLN